MATHYLGLTTRNWRAAGRPAAERGIGLRQAAKGSLFRGVFAVAGGAGPSPVEASPGSCVRDNRMARVEAVLLLAREPLSSRKLAQITSLADGTEARTLVRVLNRYYQQQGTAFRIEEVAGGFQLLARPQFGPWLRRLYQSPVQTRLSGPALETLAVVAYRQPVLRADVEAIRGVQSAEILRQLMERDLVKIVGRSPELGRPFLYGTTKRFLRIFGLRHVDDLPRVASLRQAPSAPQTTETPPGRSGDLEISNCQRQEESDVRITALLEPPFRKLPKASQQAWPLETPPATRAAKDDDDAEEDDLDDEDDDLDDDEDDLEEDDLEEEEWEEVDDEDEEEEFDDEDEDWEDEDEDDDWDDDEDEDWEEEDEPD